MSDLITVKYQRRYEPWDYAGRDYTYRTTIDDLTVGDLVIAPVKDEFSIAQVSAVDVPESKVDERIMPLLKTIEKRWEKAPCQTQQ